MNRLPASTGWLWLQQGFALFRKQPGLLIMLLFPQIMFTLLMFYIQPVGGIVFILLMPSFSMVILEASRVLARGDKLTRAVVLTGFRKDALGPLVRLGAVYLGLVLILILVMYPFLDKHAILSAYEVSQKSGQPPVLPDSMMRTIMGFMFIGSAIIFILSFAAPLIHWKKMPTFKAIFYSVFAMLGSIGPVLVMVVTWGAIWLVVMSIGGALLGKSLGAILLMWFHLVMLVVFQCATYAAYQRLIPDGPAERV